jgi:hypothetical protein
MRSKIPTILAILVLITGVAAGVFLISSSQTLKIGASPDVAPQDVRITNITDTSFTVSWITDKSTVGFVQYGTTESVNQNTTTSESLNLHFAKVSGLTASTSYFIKINSAGSVYDNNGIPWSTKTAPVLSSNGNSQVASGTILNATGQPAAGVLVYLTIAGASPLSTITSSTGSWIISLADVRSADLTSSVSLAPTTTLLQVFVQGGAGGVATAEIYPQSANPTPQIQLGKTYDFKSEPPNSQAGVPSSNLNLPEATATPSGGFQNLQEATATPSGTVVPAGQVTLTSVNNQETISTTKPEFFGGGPAGTVITIKLQSTLVTDSVTIPSTGNWIWTPPADLEPGTHTITLSWKDAKGVLQTLTRSFVVQASEGPSFVSTPSATIKPTFSPTPTASGSARISLPATGAAVPVTGDLTPTLALAGISIILISSSFLIWKKQY